MRPSVASSMARQAERRIMRDRPAPPGLAAEGRISPAPASVLLSFNAPQAQLARSPADKGDLEDFVSDKFRISDTIASPSPGKSPKINTGGADFL